MDLENKLIAKIGSETVYFDIRKIDYVRILTQYFEIGYEGNVLKLNEQLKKRSLLKIRKKLFQVNEKNYVNHQQLKKHGNNKIYFLDGVVYSVGSETYKKMVKEENKLIDS